MKLLKILSAFFFAFLFAFAGGQIVANVFDISAAMPTAAFFAASLIPTPKGALAITIFTAPGGAGVPFSWNMNYLPQFLSFINSVALTSLRVESAEHGVLCDWTAAGIPATANFMHVGTITAGQVAFRLADGQIDGLNVTVSGVTSAAGAVPFQISSERKGKIPFMYKNASILAANPTTFKDFTALFIPTLATATDRVEVVYSNGHTQTYEMEDLRELSVWYQQAPAIIVNNSKANIHSAKVTCAAATPAYILSVY